MARVVMWERLDTVSMERVVFTDSDGVMLANGLVIGITGEGKPFKVSYSVECDAGGLKQFVAGTDGQFAGLYQGDGRWHNRDGQPLAEFEGCTSIDIVETPFTNTLAIKQLNLKPGESGEITVAWFQLAEGTWESNHQRYTCIEKSAQGSVYRFEQLSSGFTAILPFDENDLVIDYPELYRRVYPKVSDSK